MKIPPIALFLVLLASLTAYAEPLSREQVPDPLKPWTDWVLKGHEQEFCPFLESSGDHRCVWPAQLSLEIKEDGGRFSQDFRLYREDWVSLPGDATRWPLDVHLDGKPVSLINRTGYPSCRLPAGKHTVAGNFAWNHEPELLQIPAETGLVSLTLNNAHVDFPNRDPQDRLWFHKENAAPSVESRIDVEVFRRVLDSIPLILETRLNLRVSGNNREVVLGKPLPEGLVPAALNSQLPARLDPDGRLRVQVRAGDWTIDLTAHSTGPVKTLAPPTDDWTFGSNEVWAFAAQPQLRTVDIQGVAAIDPQQTRLPPEWRNLPAYLMTSGKEMRLVQKSRGDSDPAPDQLHLERTWWLDFDGGGFTISDKITGILSRSWRLELAPPQSLGRVGVSGIDQFITRLAGSHYVGVEVRQGQAQIDADSRLEGNKHRVPAVGWAHDFQSLVGRLNLPPGWRIAYASGVDEVSSSWITDWTLLDLFAVLITAMAAYRVWGPGWGIATFLALVLIYPEYRSPRWIWLGFLAADALVSVIPKGRVRVAIATVRFAVLLWLIAIAVPFMILQMRDGLFPALEPHQANIRPLMAQAEQAGPVGLAENFATSQMAPAPPPPPPMMAKAPALAPGALVGSAAGRPGAGAMIGGGLGALGGGAFGAGTGAIVPNVVAPPPPPPISDVYRAVDPNALISTGPGLPRWEWRPIGLTWRGPVTSAQQIHFWLTGPRLNLFLALLRVALVALLLTRALRSLTGLRQRIFPTSNVAVAATSLVLILAAFGASNAADFPSQELLNDLQRKLLEPRECVPNCATIPRMRLEIAGPALVIRMEINALAETAIPLPGGARSFVPAKVALDGNPADAMLGTAEGALWLQVHPGVHQVLIEGPIPPTDNVDIHLTLKPYRAEVDAPSWVISGIHEDGTADDNISLSRQRAAGEKSVSVEPGQLPPFLRVDRNIHLGLQWEAETSVSRLNSTGVPVTIQVPLLPGESITTGGIHVEGDKATISLGPGVGTVAWHSTIKPAQQLQLTAPTGSSWTEFWRLDASPFWHVEATGIPVVHSVLTDSPIRDREWSPWPGEAVSLTITRPEGVPGETVTIDSTNLDVRPGRRSMESTITLELRSSRGGERTFMLPEGAVLTSFAINGVTQPLRQNHRSVNVTLTPGTQSVELKWMQDRGIKTRLAAPQFQTGLTSVNAYTTIEMPPDRWTLFTGGGLLGPAVLFWGLVAIFLLVSIALSRIGLAPLGAAQWFLLSLGMTQTPFWMAGVVAGWLLALGWRRRNSDSLGKLPFRALQVLLVIWTAVALVFIFISIRKGLLGLPEMQISGNESTSELLRWFHDRSGAKLPSPWVISVPLMAYRVAMLAWALWLAWAMLSWLRWGWEAFSTGSLWRSSAAPGKSEAAE